MAYFFFIYRMPLYRIAQLSIVLHTIKKYADWADANHTLFAYSMFSACAESFPAAYAISTLQTYVNTASLGHSHKTQHIQGQEE